MNEKNRGESSLQTAVRWAWNAWLVYGYFKMAVYIYRFFTYKPPTEADLPDLDEILDENREIMRREWKHFNQAKADLVPLLRNYKQAIFAEHPGWLKTRGLKLNRWQVFEDTRLGQALRQELDGIRQGLSALRFPSKAQAAKRDKILNWIGRIEAQEAAYHAKEDAHDKAVRQPRNRDRLWQYMKSNGYFNLPRPPMSKYWRIVWTWSAIVLAMYIGCLCLYIFCPDW